MAPEIQPKVPSPKNVEILGKRKRLADVTDLCDEVYATTEPSCVIPTPQKQPRSIQHKDSSTATSDSVLQLPTPDPSPKKDTRLQDIPEIADRYIPKYSTTKGIEYTNPQKFTLKPAFWKKWSGRDYIRFAEHLRYQFDATRFARETGKPLEEIQHVFSAIVVNPLYSLSEAKHRGEEGMNQILEVYNRSGTPTRPWGRRQEVMGELDGVAAGSVRLILKNGSVKVLDLKQLSEGDIKYLKDTLVNEDAQKLWAVGMEEETSKRHCNT